MAIIPYADVIDRQFLPIDAQDIVTKVRLVVAGNAAGHSPERLTAFATDDPDTTDTVPYAAWPVTFEYEAPEHALYGCERSFALPAGVNPFLPPTAVEIPEPTAVGFANPGSPSAVRDGDPTTFAEYTGGIGNIGWLAYPFVDGVVGFRLRYTLTSVAASTGDQVRTHARLALSPRTSGARFYGMVAANTGTLPDASEPAELYMVVPPPASWADENGPAEAPHVGRFGQAWFETFINVTACRVHEFYPLMLDQALLLDVAKAQVRLPAQTPARVTVRGVIPPDRQHTITGWPGGDFTGTVAQVQYDLGRTVIDFEQAGAPVGLPAEAMEAARERQGTIRGEIAAANYDLMMGLRG